MSSGFPRARVGMLLNALHFGGAEQLVVNLLRHWRHDAKADVVVIVLRGGGALEPVVRQMGWPIRALEGRYRADPSAVTRLIALLRRERIELLHAHLPRSGALGGVASRWCEIPTLYTEHSCWTTYHFHRVTQLAHRFCLPLHREVVAVSQEVLKHVVQQFPSLAGRVTVIENGVPVEVLTAHSVSRAAVRAHLGLTEDESLILNVANLRAVKNQAGLIRAFALLPPHIRTSSRLLIVGRDDGEGHALRILLDRLGLDSRVWITGPAHNVPQLMAASDVFVLPSIVEGLPTVLLEAGALARPCIATRVGGVPNIISSDKHGWLVEPHDDEALATAIREALADRAQAAIRGGTLGKRVQERFSIEHVADEYQAIFQRMLSRPS